MDVNGHLAAIERDGTAFLASCSRIPGGERILSCPEWDADDLLWHLAEVHHFWRRIVELEAQTYDAVAGLVRPAAAELPELYHRNLEALLSVLRTADPEAAVWTWASQMDVRFIVRRLAQETAMHRWDADATAGAAGSKPALDASLASDGIDEFLEHFIDRPAGGARLVGSVHIHCTDVAGEWLTVSTEAGLRTTREHAKGDAAIRGTASDLLLALWRRIPSSELEIIGNRDVAEQLLAYAQLG
jgi:uncharacterized protein (TIGR03083 family)